MKRVLQGRAGTHGITATAVVAWIALGVAVVCLLLLGIVWWEGRYDLHDAKAKLSVGMTLQQVQGILPCAPANVYQDEGETVYYYERVHCLLPGSEAQFLTIHVNKSGHVVEISYDQM